MTAPTPEQRADWRVLAADLDAYAENGGDVAASAAINALLDALDETEREARRWERWATAAANDFDNMSDRLHGLGRHMAQAGERYWRQELNAAISGPVDA
jgi:hypothetical protein